MSMRSIDRSVAKNLYDKFSATWRREKRMSGQYGKPGARKPTFNQWYKMHMGNRDMMKQSTPADVQEYLYAEDPWAQQPIEVPIVEQPEERRGVETINIAGDDIE